MQRNELSDYLETILLLLFGILFISFPLVLSTLTTDSIALPKQLLLGGVVLVSLILFGVKMISDGKVLIRLTPFDLPLTIFTVVVLLSSFFAVNRYDSIIAFVPLLFAVVSYFVLVNIARTQNSLEYMQSALVLGAIVVSANALLSYFKIFLLPFPFTHVQTFTPLGTLLDQALFLAFVLPVSLYFTMPLFQATTLQEFQNLKPKTLGFLLASIMLILGLSITLYELLILKIPGSVLLLLPFETGFQTAFAAISQDTGRIIQGFLFGSGFGTYAVDFMRFKQPAFNLYQDIWNLTFFRSSSFVLELLSTTGFLGISSFFLVLSKIFRRNGGSNFSKNPFFLSLVLACIAAFLLPFSFTIYALLFLLLGLFSASQVLHDPKRFFDVKLQFVALKEGLVSFSGIPLESAREEKVGVKFLPITFLILFATLALIVGYFSVRFAISDVAMQESLVAASQNNGSLTYQLQSKAIDTFPYEDNYRRIFSQINIQLANSLSASTPKGASPSAQTQQTIVNLIQQSIQEARSAVALSPQTSLNWQNLSSIYRSLIGVGRNAENFALSAAQQSALLDPNNPNQYLTLGGIYYQLSLWEEAQRQFAVAVNLKPDFANAHYNLGHALENKGDLQNALAQYQAVKTLVASDSNLLKIINADIEALQKKIGETTATPTAAQTSAATQPPLALPTPQTLPAPEKPITIPPPTATESAK